MDCTSERYKKSGLIKRSICIIVLSSLCNIVLADRLPLKKQDPSEFFKSAVPYVMPKEGAAEVKHSPHFDPSLPPVLTYDNTTKNYTYWYTRHTGERYYTTFELANKVKMVVNARVERTTGGKNYIYNYTFRILQSTQQALRYIIFPLNPDIVEEISVSEGWRVLMARKRPPEVVKQIGPRPNRILIGNKDPRGFTTKGGTLTVSIKSSLPPRFIEVYAAGYNTHPTFPRGEAPQDFALGVKGNSVWGMTVGPDDSSLASPLETLKQTVRTAGDWGWISKEMRKSIEKKIDDFPSTRKTIRQLLSEIDTTAGRVSPEIHAMIGEISNGL